MAQRAWNEGYFPELDRPPTVQEFLAALDDTYRGVGRRFRPDDEAQIEAFEGARDQRLAEERAKQEGAPLAQRSEEHTSELQSLMRISYAVFCLTQKKDKHQHYNTK